MRIKGDENATERLRKYGCQAVLDADEQVAALIEALELSDLDLMTIRDLMAHIPDAADIDLALVLALLLAALGEGSLCLQLDRHRPRRTDARLREKAVLPRIAGFMRKMDGGRYDGLIDRTGGGGFKPLVLDEARGRSWLYFQKFYSHEKRLKKSLARFLALPERQRPDEAVLDAVIDGLYEDGGIIRSGIGGPPIVRDPFQVAAIRAALTLPLLIVSGGPGTGKTSLLVNILRALVQTGTDPACIRLAAPTGRAALRMSEALTASLATIDMPEEKDVGLRRLRGSTLHKMLAYSNRSGRFLYGRQRPLDADVIAVDEVSMVDVIMMDRLFQAIDPLRTRVILLGDKDQLPSVEAGAVLADLSPTVDSPFSDHFVVLNNCYRSAGQLLDLAKTINAGRSFSPEPVAFEEALMMGAGQWAFVDVRGEKALRSDLDRWIQHHYLDRRPGYAGSYVEMAAKLASLSGGSGESGQWRQHVETLFSFAHRCRILSLVRRGPRGADWLNNTIAGTLGPPFDPSGRPESRLFNGALIMITRNDYERGLFNGDVGLVLLHPKGVHQACFRRDDGPAMFPVASLPHWELAFAMTVHKSQGSEFQDTWLILPEDPGHRLLTREIVYTAATRASRRLVMSGSADVLQAALKRKIQRQSGLIG